MIARGDPEELREPDVATSAPRRDGGRSTATTLAIAAHSFRSPSETFIRAHVRTVWPEATVLLSEDDGGIEAFGCPALTPLDPRPPGDSLGAQVAYRLGRLRRPFDPALTGASERRLRAFLEAHGPRALLAEYGPMGARLRLACRHARVPLFVHFHGFDVTQLGRSLRWRRYYRRLFADAAGVIAPSRFLADRLADLGCPAAKLHVSPCGIALHAFHPTTREAGRIVAVGRLTEKKAPHLTIRAFARVHEALPHARLELVGDGPLRDLCTETIAGAGLEEVVTLHGLRPPETVAGLLSGAAVFVQHSVTAANGDMEGLPVGILEAMAAAVPVVATRHSGIPEAVVHGETGLLVEEGDVAGMADAVAGLLRDPERAARMGAAGRERVAARFTHEHVAERLRDIMHLAGRDRGG